MPDINKFQNELSEKLFSPYGDGQFETIRAVTCGMSGVKTAKLINHAVSCLHEGEMYLEIGVFTGFTLVSSNRGMFRKAIGVDNSSEFGDQSPRLKMNIELFGNMNIEIIKDDFRSLGISEHNRGKIGVLYIDGKHDYKEVIDTFTWAEGGFLADNAIIILDDLSIPGVADAITDWCEGHKEYKTVLFFRPFLGNFFKQDIAIGLGIAILIRGGKK